MFNKINSLKYYVHKVLPLSYDDSLSYYEVLSKVVTKLNEVIHTTNAIPDYIREYIESSELEQTIMLIYERIRKQIASADETSETATVDHAKDSLVWVNNYLYKVLRNIYAGDRFVVNSNIGKITVEEYINEIVTVLMDLIADETSARESAITNVTTLISAETTERENAIQTVVALVNTEETNRESEIERIETLIDSNVSELETLIGNETSERESDVATLGQAIANESEERENAIAELEEELNSIVGVGKISDLEELTVANVQQMIYDFDIIDFDEDLNIGDSTLQVPSNKEIYSSNGSVVRGNAIMFQMLGNIVDADITLAFDSLNHGTFSGGEIDEDLEYYIRSTFDCLKREAGFPSFMGFGTVNNTICYPAIFTRFTKIDNDEFIIGSKTYARFTNANLFVFNPVRNVYIHDMTIHSSSTTAGKNYAPIVIDRCENIKIENCSVNKEYGFVIYTSLSHDCVITNNNVTVNDMDISEGGIYDDNAVELVGCEHCRVTNNTLVGSQPIDITFSGTDKSASSFCEISGNNIYANVTGINTHPGTFGCHIFNNNVWTEKGGISLRGSSHIVNDNVVTKNNRTVDSYGLSVINGCACMSFSNNTCIGFSTAIRISDSGDADEIYPSAGICYFDFNNNTFISCGTFLGLAIYVNTNVSLNIHANNNVMINAYDDTTNFYLINQAGNGTATVSLCNITGLVLDKHRFYNAIRANSATLSRFFLDVVMNYNGAYSKKYAGSGQVNNCYLTLRGTGSDSGASGTTLNAIPTI